jgi:hypothetical protein
MQTQLDKIAAILRDKGKIDNFQATQRRITYRLAARIWDLKQEGWKFKKYYSGANKKNYVYEAIGRPKK